MPTHAQTRNYTPRPPKQHHSLPDKLCIKVSSSNIHARLVRLLQAVPVDRISTTVKDPRFWCLRWVGSPIANALKGQAHPWFEVSKGCALLFSSVNGARSPMFSSVSAHQCFEVSKGHVHPCFEVSKRHAHPCFEVSKGHAHPCFEVSEGHAHPCF